VVRVVGDGQAGKASHGLVRVGSDPDYWPRSGRGRGFDPNGGNVGAGLDSVSTQSGGHAMNNARDCARINMK
jgi:hypothetical protein